MEPISFSLWVCVCVFVVMGTNLYNTVSNRAFNLGLFWLTLTKAMQTSGLMTSQFDVGILLVYHLLQSFVG